MLGWLWLVWVALGECLDFFYKINDSNPLLTSLRLPLSMHIESEPLNLRFRYSGYMPVTLVDSNKGMERLHLKIVSLGGTIPMQTNYG